MRYWSEFDIVILKWRRQHVVMAVAVVISCSGTCTNIGTDVNANVRVLRQFDIIALLRVIYR